MSSISIIPTLDMVAQQGAKLNRDITLNGGHNITLNNVGNTVTQMLAGIDDGLLIDSTLATPDLILRNTNNENVTINNTTGILTLSAKDANTAVRSTGAALGVPSRSSEPPNSTDGDIYYDTTVGEFFIHVEGSWTNLW